MERVDDQAEREPSKGGMKPSSLATVRKFFSSRPSENLRAAGSNWRSMPVVHPDAQDRGSTNCFPSYARGNKSGSQEMKKLVAACEPHALVSLDSVFDKD